MRSTFLLHSCCSGIGVLSLNDYSRTIIALMLKWCSPHSKFKNYFSLKCHTPMPLMANVVYQFTCLRDANSTYIGKTIRHLATRVREHTTSPSTIKEHLSSCTTCKDNYSCNSFKVTDSANSDFEVSIKEALHIKYKNRNLNKQLSTQGRSFMLKIFT